MVKTSNWMAVALCVFLAGCLTDEESASRSASAEPAAAPSETSGQTSAADTFAGVQNASADYAAQAALAGASVPVPLPSPRRAMKVSLNPHALDVQQLELATYYQSRFAQAVQSARSDTMSRPNDVRRLLASLRFNDPDALSVSWYARYGVVASENALFRKGVLQAMKRQGSQRLLAQLDGQNGFAAKLPGAGSATADVLTAISAEDELMSEVQKRFLDTAYGFQKQRWGMLETPAGRTGDAGERDIADADETDGSVHWAALLQELAGIKSAQAYNTTVMMERVLALGARDIIAEATGEDLPPIDISDRFAETCLNWARLNLNQCLSAAHFPSEEAWCASKHAVEEVRTCWARALPLQFAANTK